ncbi:MAG: acyl-CoA dehydratase activase [Desulfatibacillaceae bacterium]|nr:acyl-CoA dehydratase activase [Desulfatibacillaceae bacterium]
MEFFAGIDAGSTSTEMVLMDSHANIVAFSKAPTAGNILDAAASVLGQVLASAGIGRDRICRIVATGYGRKTVPFADCAVTEITCYALGAFHLDPAVRSVIDIGGQDSKFIALGPDGRVKNFVMNDKCAAGTGRFLEMIARTFAVSLDELGPLALTHKNKVKISNICAVFAESEMISLFSQGVLREDIINAAHQAIGERIGSMMGRVGLEEKVFFCGGVAKNPGMVQKLEQVLGVGLALPEDVETVGAIGAALHAIKTARQEVGGHNQG